MVLAFPNASKRVFACTKWSFINLHSKLSPETSTKNCKTILAASVFPEPVSPKKYLTICSLHTKC